ncbi:MAG TPA: sigma-70 family RNA polymerase sigma factor [Phycisphaerae bacterium]|nr:sigma-70 family RNA polymerase sigma factor [Phycisphaerae bacterium]
MNQEHGIARIPFLHWISSRLRKKSHKLPYPHAIKISRQVSSVRNQTYGSVVLFFPSPSHPLQVRGTILQFGAVFGRGFIMAQALAVSRMMAIVDHDAVNLLRRARSGHAEAIGTLLKSYSAYLMLIARAQIGRKLQVKLDPDDLVQETFLEAHRQFSRFRGTCEAEFTSWLRCLMAGQIAQNVRRYLGTQARDMQLERQLNAQIDDASRGLDQTLAASGSSPSQNLIRREQSVLLADALNLLEPHYREVIILRHIEQLTFAEVGTRMGRSEDSVQKLWVRALGELRRAMGAGRETP